MGLGLVHGHRHLTHLARLLHKLRAVQGQQRNPQGLRITQRKSRTHHTLMFTPHIVLQKTIHSS